MNATRIAALMGLLLGSAPATAGVLPYETHTRTLDNGLETVVIPMSSPGVAAWTVWMQVGSRDEVTEGRTGFAHFFEHLMFYGTEELGMDEREQRLLAMGAQENAWTWFDETVYHAVLPASELEAMIALESGRFEDLHLTPDAVRREAGAVHGEFRKSQASPAGRAWETLYATAFTTHTYGHDTLGLEADIARYPDAQADAMDFFARYYRPDRARILVAGDVDPEAVFATVEAHWGDWSTEGPERPPIPQEPQQTEPRSATVEWPSPTATHHLIGWRIPASRPDDADIAALQLAAELLSSPVDGLETRLVDEAGLAYSVDVSRSDWIDPGLFTIHVTLKDGVTPADVQPLIDAALDDLATLEPDHLDRTRSHARYRFLSGLDDPERVAEQLGWAMRRAGSVDAIDTWFATLDAVSPADVAAVAERTFVDAHRTTVTLGQDVGASEPPATPPEVSP